MQKNYSIFFRNVGVILNNLLIQNVFLIKWNILSNLDLNSCVMLCIICDEKHDMFIIFKPLVLHQRMIGLVHELVTYVVTQEHVLRKSPHNLFDDQLSKRQCSMHIYKGDVYNICILFLSSPFVYSICDTSWSQNSRSPTIHEIQQDSKQIEGKLVTSTII